MEIGDLVLVQWDKKREFHRVEPLWPDQSPVPEHVAISSNSHSCKMPIQVSRDRIQFTLSRAKARAAWDYMKQLPPDEQKRARHYFSALMTGQTITDPPG